ncbi:hypothetical protein WA026_015191 [Henosepilachna vigintioctopunctata]|uniref:Proton-coupled folate transporter n=1 Tax=Henosepilachna vigintioctopunctata TaxID=420089 RepID=A0AAW1TUE0_9CUCU
MTSTVDLVNQSNGDLSEEKKTFIHLTFAEKFKYVREVITVEPLLTAYLVAAVICLPALLTLEYQKACLSNLGLNETVCQAIRESKHENYSDVNKEITILLSNIHSWQVPCQNIAPFILVLFLGSYSDRHQIRKPFMVLPLIGELFAVLGCILSVIFMKEWPVEIQGVLQTIVPSLFGGSTLVIMAIFSYIADSSTIEMRTLRVAVVQTVLNVALPVGQFLSGILFIHLDYIGVLSIAACLYTFGIVYGIFCIKETKKPKETSEKKNLLLDILDPTNALDTIKVLFKINTNPNITYFWTILSMFFIVTGVTSVGYTTLFAYFQNVFFWTGPDFSYYSTANTVIHLIGIVVFVPLFTKIFRISDVTILVFTYLDKIVSTVILGLAGSNVVIYIGCLVSIISNITIIALRSLATKVVSEDDLGKAQSLIGICEAVGIAALTPFFNTIFVNTLSKAPSTFIFCESVAYGICFLMALFFYFQNFVPEEKENRDQNTTENVKMDDIQI